MYQLFLRSFIPTVPLVLYSSIPLDPLFLCTSYSSVPLYVVFLCSCVPTIVLFLCTHWSSVPLCPLFLRTWCSSALVYPLFLCSCVPSDPLSLCSCAGTVGVSVRAYYPCELIVNYLRVRYIRDYPKDQTSAAKPRSHGLLTCSKIRHVLVTVQFTGRDIPLQTSSGVAILVSLQECGFFSI